jgi:DNA-binding transcriptional MocR family regulator
VYVTPARQVPLSSRLSLERRLALLKWAYEQRSWVFEDDYDNEFRYDGPPFAALKALDSANAVLYAGSFSKMPFPALRLAYLVVPPALIDGFAAARSLVDRFPAVLAQATLCDFIAEGNFARHRRSMKWSTNSRKMVPVRERFRQGAQTTYSPLILAKWAKISPESPSQNTNQGSPSSVTPLSVSRASPTLHKSAITRWNCASS